MPTLADLVNSYTRIPSARCYLDGRRWYGVQKLSTHQKFGEKISTGTAEGRDPPTTPRIGMEIRWSWGYNGVEVNGFTGEISDPSEASYPNRTTLQCKDVLWRADKSSQVLQTDPLNEIAASDAVRYLLTHYGGISSSRLSIPVLPASGAAWAGSEWVLGILTPVQWGDIDQESGGTTALNAAAEICNCLGYWLYADAGGTIRAKQMEKKPSLVAREVFERNKNLLVQGAPVRRQSYENIYNQVSVRGADTGVDGAQLFDQWRDSHPLLQPGVYRDFPFSSFLLEYENATDAGLASVTEVAKRIHKVVSRIPDTDTHRAKADPRRAVGDTVGLIDVGVSLSAQKNFFIYEITRSLDLGSGAFDDDLSLDGGTGSSGFTTVPPPDASFSWTLMAETADGNAIVEVALDGSASTSPSGEIVSWAWSTATPTYSGTPNSATGVNAVLIFLASNTPVTITLTVTDTTSKTATFETAIDLTGADTAPPVQEVLSAAAGAAWYITQDGGANWAIETSNGAAIAVGTIGAGADDRSPTAAATDGMLATRGASGAGGLRRTLDALATPSTNLVANASAITSNIWVNEANPARVWFAIGNTPYRSIDGGLTKTAMAALGATITWIMEDAAVEDSVFLLAGADMYNATEPTLGWALLYAGPLGATARQFVRSRDGQVTWVCYTGAPAGAALSRVETGALADFDATDVRSLALDREASGLRATLYAITGDDPAEIWSFDALTGLSALQSSQFFPAGATVQHMLGSRQFDVIYTADFDSIDVGQGALRKYFPVADQLLLWKSLAAGEQGHMLGLGARVSGAFEVLLMSFGVDPGGVWHYSSGAWAFRALPQAGTVRGLQIASDPFYPDRWLAVFNNSSTLTAGSGGTLVGATWAHSPLWFTNDAGVTWTEVLIDTPPGIPTNAVFGGIAWSEQFANEWAAVLGNTGYTAVIKGTGAAVTSITETNAFVSTAIASGLDGDFIIMGRISAGVGKLYYIDATNIIHTPAGSSPGDLYADVLLYRTLDREPGGSYACFAASVAAPSMYHTSDYRSAQPTLLLSSGDEVTAAVSTQALYYTDGGETAGGSGVWRVSDPLGAATVTQLAGGITTAHVTVRVDRQTRTLAGLWIGSAILIDDGTTTTRLPLTLDGSKLAFGAAFGPSAFEIIVRT